MQLRVNSPDLLHWKRTELVARFEWRRLRFWRRTPPEPDANVVKAAPVSKMFVPPELNTEDFRGRVEKLVVELDFENTRSVGALDSLIGAWADQWIAELSARSAEYLLQCELMESDASVHAEASRNRLQLELDRLDAARISLEAALAHIVAEPIEPKEDDANG